MGVLDIDAVGWLSNDVPVHGHGAADTTTALNQEADQELDGDISDADVSKLAPPLAPFHLHRVQISQGSICVYIKNSYLCYRYSSGLSPLSSSMN